MVPLPSTYNRHRAFTLIELLTVMTIIAVLVGLLFPVFGSVTTNARKTQASSDEQHIITAVMAYQSDYGKLPLNGDNAGYTTCYGDPGDKARYPSFELFDILRAIPETDVPAYNWQNQANPKQVVYFQGQNVKNPNDPRSGFLTQNHFDGSYTIKARSLVDPWGSEYVVWLDGNNSGDLTIPASWFYYDYAGLSNRVSAPVQVTSMGPDSGFGTNGNQILKGSDDITTFYQ